MILNVLIGIKHNQTAFNLVYAGACGLKDRALDSI